MKVKTLQIHWHNKQPIYSVDFDPQNPQKLATCGGDNNIRLWKVSSIEGEGAQVEYLATLSKHLKSVNCVRFSPNGEYLASAGDGGLVILWKQSDGPIQFNKALGDDSDTDDTDRKEFWSPVSQFRAMDGEDVYDIAWSPCSKFIAFGLTDNTTQVWEIAASKMIRCLKDHQHFVQGVAWDPLDQLLVTQSSDRSVKIWTIRQRQPPQFVSVTKVTKTEDGFALFHDETLVSFFRRPAFSPDGAILAMPAALKTPATPNAASSHGIYLNWRNNLHRDPVAFIGGFEKAAVGIKFNPKLFKLPGDVEPYVPLPYVLVYAVVTQNTVYVFDTLRRTAIYAFGNLHYASLTDAAWSCDGFTLMISSVDGFCTAVQFSEGDFGCAVIEDQAAVLDSIAQVIKASTFHNPPPKLPAKKLQSVDDSILLSSELDIDDAGEAEPVEISIENDSNFSTTAGANFSTTGEVSTTAPSTSNATIHCPPIKKRIAPTLLSNVTSNSTNQ